MPCSFLCYSSHLNYIAFQMIATVKDRVRENPSALVIRALLQNRHELSVYSKNLAYALPAMVIELDTYSGQLVLEAESEGGDIERYIGDRGLSFDIEALKKADSHEREVYSLSNVAAKALKTDRTTYRLECQLPESVFVEERRGGIRIPFIMGMHARISIEVYLHELSIHGQVRNLSLGGCMADIDIADSIAITVGQAVPGITVEFPSGEKFFAEARVRHMRPFGQHGRAAIGLQFLNLTPDQTDALFHYVLETEREAAFRSKSNEKITSHSHLFIAGAKEKKILQREEQERQSRSRRSPAQRDIQKVAHQLQVALMYIKAREVFPEETLYHCADIILHWVQSDRRALLHALAFLYNEPAWARHAIQVAVRLADTMSIRDPHAIETREAVLGAIMHTMGKPLLISEQLPSLKAHMKPDQKKILKTHVVTLGAKLRALDWKPSPICADIVENANERLDGSGYPSGKRGDDLSDLVRLISILKIVNKLTHERNGAPPREPLDAYRWINEESNAFDKTILVEYIQNYGLYPIGSLAKFSGGFLAWIMHINSKGMPTRVQVVKNLAFIDTNIDSILDSEDFSQIGKLEGIVSPDDYGVRPGQGPKKM